MAGECGHWLQFGNSDKVGTCQLNGGFCSGSFFFHPGCRSMGGDGQLVLDLREPEAEGRP